MLEDDARVHELRVEQRKLNARDGHDRASLLRAVVGRRAEDVRLAVAEPVARPPCVRRGRERVHEDLPSPVVTKVRGHRGHVWKDRLLDWEEVFLDDLAITRPRVRALVFVRELEREVELVRRSEGIYRRYSHILLDPKQAVELLPIQVWVARPPPAPLPGRLLVSGAHRALLQVGCCCKNGEDDLERARVELGVDSVVPHVITFLRHAEEALCGRRADEHIAPDHHREIQVCFGRVWRRFV
mmetsp:Transcript_47948/g.113534  ORF Transcript_47948/g.113534 Transcript_47948/m.113534 type:complete len:242 (-) Transcript_47948:661-1386(-)